MASTDRALVVVLCGCGRIGFDATTDGSVADADRDTVALTCTSVPPAEDFELAGQPCAAWGFPTMTGMTMVRNLGALEIALGTPTGNDFGGCTLNNYDLTRGAFAEVTSVLGGQNGYTNFAVNTPTGIGIQIEGFNGHIVVIGNGSNDVSQPYDAVAMRFLRLVPTGSLLHLGTSPDALHWTD